MTKISSTHYWNNNNYAERLRFSVFQNPQKDVLEKRHVIEETTILFDGWTLEGSYGEKRWPLSMTNGNSTVKFDYRNKAATRFDSGKETSKTWFSAFDDPVTNYLKQSQCPRTWKHIRIGLTPNWNLWQKEMIE